MNEKKVYLRKELLAKRDAFQGLEKMLLDNKLCGKIEAVIESRKAKVIHTYLPFGSEIDIYPLIRNLLDKGYTVVCPKALPKKELQNLVLHSLDQLEEGRFGTKHPANSEEYIGSIDLFIVPGIGFNKDNYRLGYGSGYYDKFFTEHPNGYKLGVCYDFQIIDDLPVEEHDVPLDKVIY